MQLWRRPAPVMLALLALATTVLPAFAWYCPMTGRWGEAKAVCSTDPVSGMHCARPGGKCCRRLPVPPGDASTGPERPVAHARVFVRAADLAAHPAADAWIPVHYDIAATASPNLPTLPRAASSARAGPACYLGAQHGLPPFSGRAPPLV